jgi:hypothetical protein
MKHEQPEVAFTLSVGTGLGNAVSPIDDRYAMSFQRDLAQGPTKALRT